MSIEHDDAGVHCSCHASVFSNDLDSGLFSMLYATPAVNLPTNRPFQHNPNHTCIHCQLQTDFVSLVPFCPMCCSSADRTQNPSSAPAPRTQSNPTADGPIPSKFMVVKPMIGLILRRLGRLQRRWQSMISNMLTRGNGSKK